MFELPKFSIILPTYNRANLLPRSVQSIVDQTYPHWQLLIVDDGSTDHTQEKLFNIITQYPQEVREKIITIKISNQGVSAARNKGVEKSQYPWIAFIDSDDQWLPHKLNLQAQYIVDHPNTKWLHGDEIWIKNGKHFNQHKKHKKSGGRIYKNCLPLCAISPSTVCIQKNFYIENKGFNPEYPVCEDYDLWLTLSSKMNIGFIEEPLIKKYGGHSDQLSQKYKAMDYWRIKSLYRLLKSTNLSEEEKELTQLTLIKKAKILLNGYKKHNNLNNFDEIKNLLERVDTLN